MLRKLAIAVVLTIGAGFTAAEASAFESAWHGGQHHGGWPGGWWGSRVGTPRLCPFRYDGGSYQTRWIPE